MTWRNILKWDKECCDEARKKTVHQMRETYQTIVAAQPAPAHVRRHTEILIEQMENSSCELLRNFLTRSQQPLPAHMRNLEIDPIIERDQIVFGKILAEWNLCEEYR